MIARSCKIECNSQVDRSYLACPVRLYPICVSWEALLGPLAGPITGKFHACHLAVHRLKIHVIQVIKI